MTEHFIPREADGSLPAMYTAEFWVGTYDLAIASGCFEAAARIRDLGLDGGLIARRLN